MANRASFAKYRKLTSWRIASLPQCRGRIELFSSNFPAVWLGRWRQWNQKIGEARGSHISRHSLQNTRSWASIEPHQLGPCKRRGNRRQNISLPHCWGYHGCKFEWGCSYPWPSSSSSLRWWRKQWFVLGVVIIDNAEGREDQHLPPLVAPADKNSNEQEETLPLPKTLSGRVTQCSKKPYSEWLILPS